jgi:L-lactate dehydrogenase (cytochrome)
MGDKGDLDPNDVSGHPDESPTFPHPPPTSGLRVITKSELAHHNTEAMGYWIAIEGQVYDLSGFIESGAHPGGNGVLKRHAGADATGVYGPIHPKGTIEENLDEGCLIGMMDPSGE